MFSHLMTACPSSVYSKPMLAMIATTRISLRLFPPRPPGGPHRIAWRHSFCPVFRPRVHPPYDGAPYSAFSIHRTRVRGWFRWRSPWSVSLQQGHCQSGTEGRGEGDGVVSVIAAHGRLEIGLTWYRPPACSSRWYPCRQENLWRRNLPLKDAL